MSYGVLKKEQPALKALPSTTLNSMLYKGFSLLQNYQIYQGLKSKIWPTEQEKQVVYVYAVYA